MRKILLNTSWRPEQGPGTVYLGNENNEESYPLTYDSSYYHRGLVEQIDGKLYYIFDERPLNGGSPIDFIYFQVGRNGSIYFDVIDGELILDGISPEQNYVEIPTKLFKDAPFKMVEQESILNEYKGRVEYWYTPGYERPEIELNFFKEIEGHPTVEGYSERTVLRFENGKFTIDGPVVTKRYLNSKFDGPVSEVGFPEVIEVEGKPAVNSMTSSVVIQEDGSALIEVRRFDRPWTTNLYGYVLMTTDSGAIATGGEILSSVIPINGGSIPKSNEESTNLLNIVLHEGTLKENGYVISCLVKNPAQSVRLRVFEDTEIRNDWDLDIEYSDFQKIYEILDMKMSDADLQEDTPDLYDGIYDGNSGGIRRKGNKLYVFFSPSNGENYLPRYRGSIYYNGKPVGALEGNHIRYFKFLKKGKGPSSSLPSIVWPFGGVRYHRFFLFEDIPDNSIVEIKTQKRSGLETYKIRWIDKERTFGEEVDSNIEIPDSDFIEME